MIKKSITIFLITSALVSFFSLDSTRSPHRPRNPETPSIVTHWIGDNKKYTLQDSHLKVGPLFRVFDKDFFYTHLLPQGSIPYRYDNSNSVLGTTLSDCIERFIIEIKQKKKKFADFTILKKRDFNGKRQTGLIIAKFKQYPFVVKIFIETPESFVNPFIKGFEPCCFFIMGSGNRYLNGFTRIKNLERLQKKIAESSYWSSCVDFPRKWFWIGNNTRWFELTGFNLGPYKSISVKLPSTYAIICDYIEIERSFSLHNKEDTQIALSLANYLQQNIDPHINNYVIEKNTGTIVPIDSEHFPTMVGIQQPPLCTGYIQWYSHLTGKMFYDTFGKSKQDRYESQHKEHWPLGFFDSPHVVTQH